MYLPLTYWSLRLNMLLFFRSVSKGNITINPTASWLYIYDISLSLSLVDARAKEKSYNKVYLKQHLVTWQGSSHPLSRTSLRGTSFSQSAGLSTSSSAAHNTKNATTEALVQPLIKSTLHDVNGLAAPRQSVPWVVTKHCLNVSDADQLYFVLMATLGNPW